MEYHSGGDLHKPIKPCNLHSTTVDPILATAPPAKDKNIARGP
jgi:hypothetical protein